jgi:hypothetical protein
MSVLPTLQGDFSRYVIDGDGAIAERVNDGPRADRQRMLNVYREGYVLRLAEALAKDFPGVLAMAGGAKFDALSRAYVGAHPSRDPSIRWFGRHLPAFLSTQEPWRAIQALAEMAAFEWAMGEAFDGPDATPLGAGDLGAIAPEDWESLAFRFVPTVRRLTLRHRVPQAWQRRAETERGALTAEPEAAPVDWLVWRLALETQFRSMEPDEAWAFDAAAQGAKFGELCEGLARLVDPDDAPVRAAGLLRAWLDAGLVATVST